MFGLCDYPLILPLITLVPLHEALCPPHVWPLEFSDVRVPLISSPTAEVHWNTMLGYRTSSTMANLCLICLLFLSYYPFFNNRTSCLRTETQLLSKRENWLWQSGWVVIIHSLTHSTLTMTIHPFTWPKWEVNNVVSSALPSRASQSGTILLLSFWRQRTAIPRKTNEQCSELKVFFPPQFPFLAGLSIHKWKWMVCVVEWIAQSNPRKCITWENQTEQYSNWLRLKTETQLH